MRCYHSPEPRPSGSLINSDMRAVREPVLYDFDFPTGGYDEPFRRI